MTFCVIRLRKYQCQHVGFNRYWSVRGLHIVRVAALGGSPQPGCRLVEFSQLALVFDGGQRFSKWWFLKIGTPQKWMVYDYRL